MRFLAIHRELKVTNYMIWTTNRSLYLVMFFMRRFSPFIHIHLLSLWLIHFPTLFFILLILNLALILHLMPLFWNHPHPYLSLVDRFALSNNLLTFMITIVIFSKLPLFRIIWFTIPDTRCLTTCHTIAWLLPTRLLFFISHLHMNQNSITKILRFLSGILICVMSSMLWNVITLGRRFLFPSINIRLVASRFTSSSIMQMVQSNVIKRGLLPRGSTNMKVLIS